IEERLRKIGGPLNEFDNKQSWNDSLADQAEILTSRTVLGEVVDRLGLAIVVEPDYFPLIGKPLARVRGEREVVASPLIGSQRFAWGGESWQIQAMEIPEKFLSKSFELVVGRQGSFKLYDEENGFLAAGTVGEEVLDFLPTSDRSRILITALVANPGTVFKVKKIPRLEAIQRLQRRLVVADGGEDSSTLAISLDGQDPKRIAEILNVVVNLYVANDVERQSREARLTLNFVEQQIPGVRAALEEAEGRLNRLQSQRGSVDITSDTQTVLSKIVRLESRLGELRQSRAELIQRFTPLHPRIQSLDSQIAAQEQQLAAAEGDVKELPTTQREILSATRNVNVAS
ncbi:MAG: hypothetical protein GWN81_10845, partial [Phycisphaerae bacterium]|nr:hypothetical protein [Phycisphaerae bacterium]NIP52773.1 hypothetical protein [Phycisphaerae bacterium]NIU09320.1 hypothetical protein [Phycisphaerae bacterium]NIX28907.1 hypothetical protein [Phycisphaerae bacterium]